MPALSRRFDSATSRTLIHRPSPGTLFAATLGIASLLLVSACAQTPAGRRAWPSQARTTQPVAPPAAPARQPVSTRVYVYASPGQSADRLEQDRYECHLWAVKQSGFDPSQTALTPQQRVEVVPMPPKGVGTAHGAITGAILGAAIAHDAAAGAIGGAVLGGAAGAASDAVRVAEAKAVQRQFDQREEARLARLEAQATDYKRAVSACLEGRGYTVE